jgi:hypothetical protein
VTDHNGHPTREKLINLKQSELFIEFSFIFLDTWIFLRGGGCSENNLCWFKVFILRRIFPPVELSRPNRRHDSLYPSYAPGEVFDICPLRRALASGKIKIPEEKYTWGWAIKTLWLASVMRPFPSPRTLRGLSHESTAKEQENTCVIVEDVVLWWEWNAATKFRLLERQLRKMYKTLHTLTKQFDLATFSNLHNACLIYVYIVLLHQYTV